jgi:hypothetical protein
MNYNFIRNNDKVIDFWSYFSYNYYLSENVFFEIRDKLTRPVANKTDVLDGIIEAINTKFKYYE